jgi:xanthine dehydrogenase small subunit
LKDLAKVFGDNPQATILAGGTDLNLEITQSTREFGHIINISQVQELNVIKDEKSKIEIGSAVTYQDASSSLIKYWPELEGFLHRFASLPIKNWATIGGNIANASPIGDMPPVLIALEAKLKLRKKSGTRSVSLEDFFIGYKKTDLDEGEFIESITIPKPTIEERLITHKISKRYEDDISAVCMAMNVSLQDSQPKSVRIAFGGMSGIPQRAKKLEQVLLDYWDKEGLVQKSYSTLKEEFSPFSDVRASAEYRLQVSANLVKKSVLGIKGEALAKLAETSNESFYMKV